MSTVEPPFDGLGSVELEALTGTRSDRHLLRGSAWLSVSAMTGAVGSLLFWLFATQTASARDVGLAAALFTGVVFVNYATNFGLNIAVAHYSQDESRASAAAYTWAVAISGTTSAIGALAFLVVAPERVLAPLRSIGLLGGSAVFSSLAAMLAITALVDIRLVALRRWSWVFVRTFTVSVVRLPVLWLDPGHDRPLWIFLVAVGVPALSGLVFVGVLHGSRLTWPRSWPIPEYTRVALRYAMRNYVPVLAEHAPLLVLPLVVLVSVGSSANASFYIAWGATAFVFIVPTAIAQVFLVEGGRDDASLNDQTKLALGLSLALMLVASLAAWLGNDLVTVVYGSSYWRAARILPELVVAAIPWAVTSIGLSRARIEHDTASALRIAAIFAVAVLVPAVVWTQAAGIDGATHAWLLGNVIAAIVSGHYLLRSTRRSAVQA